MTAGEQLAESAGKQGFFGRMMSRAGGLLSAAGNRMGLGRFAGLFRGAGRLGGGALWAGAMAAPVLLDNSASAADKAGAMGSLAGSIAGGALGLPPVRSGLPLAPRWAVISVIIWGMADRSLAEITGQ